ncbi:MAG: rhodanese-like domain-containing protein [Desulfobulbaceae bacterium]|nr:rhodanese-like domain-containing protein [Desulfobulbaceae bacterium]
MKIVPSQRLLIPVALLLSGCAGTIDSATLAVRLAEPNHRPALVDVRGGGEYRDGHLPGAVNIPVQSLPFRMAEVPLPDRRQPVVVYCAHGPRAGLAGFFLRLAGFAQVSHLRGDIRSWRAAGLPLATGPEPGRYRN